MELQQLIQNFGPAVVWDENFEYVWKWDGSAQIFFFSGLTSLPCLFMGMQRRPMVPLSQIPDIQFCISRPELSEGQWSLHNDNWIHKTPPLQRGI